jgi:2OG-Fe(II) oxygenase superfamily
MESFCMSASTWVIWTILLLGAGSLLIAARWRQHTRKRQTIYRDLAKLHGDAAASRALGLSEHLVSDGQRSAFKLQRLISLPAFADAQLVGRLLNEANGNRERMVRSYIPTHKKGAALSYQAIHLHGPLCLAFYHSPLVIDCVSNIVGQVVHPTPVQDQSSLSVLAYLEGGDHINWHFDHNFYRGRHFTVLLCLENRGSNGGLSASEFIYRDRSCYEQAVPLQPGTLVLFEGARVLHKASPTIAGDCRIILSMTYCTNPEISWLKEGARRAKDTAFFGLRALWD